MPRAVELVALAALLVLAGCSFVPGGTSTPSPEPPPDVEVSLVNAANGSYDMEVLLLPRPADRARVTSADGSTREVGNLSAFDGVGMYGPGDEDDGAPRDVEPLGVDPLDTRIYRGIGPRSSVSSTFESPPRGAALFVVVSTADGVHVWATGNCGEGNDMSAFAVEIRDAGPGLSLGCESFAASGAGSGPQ